eukprot:GFUD01005656.1.p1 GENE.GFUD01005656.1~~GFUD01005656.1.p1  ORF type:complete len:972 (+),score=354.98 GFUD01005656.1:47-2962(+)
MIAEEAEDNSAGNEAVEENVKTKNSEEVISTSNGNHENPSTPKASKDFDITENFLQSMFKFDEEREARVWRNESSELPAVVQIVMVSKEKNESQAFSVCDGSGYLLNSCFISRDKEVTLNTIVKITSLENVKNDDYDKSDFLSNSSVFDDVIALAEFEVVQAGDAVGHCLWNLPSCKQLYVLASGCLDDRADQVEVLNDKDLWDLTSVPEKCDVRFEFSDGQIIHSHKHVLREKSSVFAAHFGSEAVFADQELVKITDSNFDVFQKFLKWIYGFNVQLESLETIFDLIYICDKYILEEFLDILRSKVSENLKFGPQRAAIVSNLNRTNDIQIQKIIFEVIDKNIQLLCHSGEYKKWDYESLILITGRDSLNIDEWQLLQYVFCWGEENIETQEQFLELLKNIKFEEIDKNVLKSFLNSEMTKSVFSKGLLSMSVLESMISLRLFKITSSLEKRILYSRDISNFSSYRSLEHFSSDPKDISILPPVIFPLQLTPDTLTSLPMVLLNDSFTLIQPNINLKSLKSGKFSLECLVRLNGAVTGMPDLSVFRQADYFRHVSDIQARVELHWIAGQCGQSGRGWNQVVLDLSQGGVMVFRGIDVEMVKDVMTGSQIFRGCLVVRQFRGQADRFNSSGRIEFEEEGGTESEPEGEDLGHDDDEEEETDDDDQEDLEDFIEDEAEVSGEEEEAVQDNGEDSGEDEEALEGSDEEKSSNIGKANKKKSNKYSEGSEDEDENAEAEFSDEEIKLRYKKGKGRNKKHEQFSSDDEIDDENSSNNEKANKKKVMKDSEGSEDEHDNEDEEAEFSDEEIVKKPRFKNGKINKREEFSSDEEIPRSKKRKALVDSESDDEDEARNISVKKRKKYPESDGEQSEYETDDEMGDETQDLKDSKEVNSPKAQFSRDDDPDDAKYSEADTELVNDPNVSAEETCSEELAKSQDCDSVDQVKKDTVEESGLASVHIGVSDEDVKGKDPDV